jgi:hypothetical protein
MLPFNGHKEMYCMNNMMFLNHHVEQRDGPKPLSIV